MIGQDLRAMLRGAVRVGLEACLEAELEAVIGADWYERVGGGGIIGTAIIGASC